MLKTGGWNWVVTFPGHVSGIVRPPIRSRGVLASDNMPNGKPGDHPLTDILVYGRDVYSARVAALVREIAAIAI